MPVVILNGVCEVKNPGKRLMKIEDATILCRAQNDKIGPA
jgi:hypothetical protein